MNNDIVIFKNGELELEVSVSEDKETVWLSLDQMAELFKRDRSVIGKHVRNIFKEGELQKRIRVGKICLHCCSWKSI